MINLSFFSPKFKEAFGKRSVWFILIDLAIYFLPIDIDKIIWYVMMADVLCLNKLGFCLFFGI